jgi:senataxin
MNTVDAFQGREKDVIIISCVRGGGPGGIGFLRDVRRLNVAITRAKKALWVVGHAQTLRQSPAWSALIAYADHMGCLMRV